jgi:hypothetical protein
VPALAQFRAVLAEHCPHPVRVTVLDRRPDGPRPEGLCLTTTTRVLGGDVAEVHTAVEPVLLDGPADAIRYVAAVEAVSRSGRPATPADRRGQARVRALLAGTGDHPYRGTPAQTLWCIAWDHAVRQRTPFRLDPALAAWLDAQDVRGSLPSWAGRLRVQEHAQEIWPR